jgi:formiminotetrahydrofolate cyclodeaminase
MSDTPLLNIPVSDFLERLASDAPVPGGGSVAALAGALAAALGRMVCALTAGKPKFADVTPQIEPLAARLTRSELMLKRLIDEDAAAYSELSAAFKIEKSDPGRKAKIAAAAEIAAAVPLETAAISRQVLGNLRRLESIGNPNLRSDVEAALHMARAAMLAAAANVRVNLSLLPAEQAQTVTATLENLLAVE